MSVVEIAGSGGDRGGDHTGDLHQTQFTKSFGISTYIHSYIKKVEMVDMKYALYVREGQPEYRPARIIRFYNTVHERRMAEREKKEIRSSISTMPKSAKTGRNLRLFHGGDHLLPISTRAVIVLPDTSLFPAPSVPDFPLTIYWSEDNG